MKVVDWRSCPADQIAPLFEIERRRWLSELHWDCASTLADIDCARRDGRLPGLVVIEGEAIAGWSYHLLHRGTLHIGGVVSSAPEVTARLICATFNSDQAVAASSSLAYGWFDAPGIESLLEARGHTIERYDYLVSSLTRPTAVVEPFDRYAFADARAVAGLLQRAYATAAPRPFAVSGHLDEWLEYVTQLTLGQGCGVFDRAASVVHREAGDVRAVALVSRVAPATAHLSQIAVDPLVQGRRLATRLLGAVGAATREAGCEKMSLTVSESNHAARALYRVHGFTARAQFILGVSR